MTTYLVTVSEVHAVTYRVNGCRSPEYALALLRATKDSPSVECVVDDYCCDAKPLKITVEEDV